MYFNSYRTDWLDLDFLPQYPSQIVCLINIYNLFNCICLFTGVFQVLDVHTYVNPLMPYRPAVRFFFFVSPTFGPLLS